MRKALITESHLTNIANAIISKGGASAPLRPSEMAAAIQAIPSGGGEWEILPEQADGDTHIWFEFPEGCQYCLAFFTAQFISENDFVVYWDSEDRETYDTISASASYANKSMSHVYDTPGIHHVVISGYDSIKLSVNNWFDGGDGTRGISRESVRQCEFAKLDSITSVHNAHGIVAFIAKGATYISNVFDGFSNLKFLDISGVVSLYANCFRGCVNLEHIGDLSQCTSIGTTCFDGCRKITDVGDLSSVVTLVDRQFRNCVSLKTIGDLSAATSINLNSSNLASLESIGDMTSMITQPSSGFGYQLPALKSVGDMSNLVTIANDGFRNCASLIHLDSLRACESIGLNAFIGCNSLLTIGDLSNLTTVSNGAFSGNTSIVSMTFSQKTHTEVETITGFTNFPDRGTTCVFHCSDGDFYRSSNSLLPVA